MRAAAIALTLLVASSALADRDRDRDNDPVVLNERRILERLEEVEKLLQKIDKEKKKKERSKLVAKAREEVEGLRKMVRRAPELEQGPRSPAPPRPPAGQPQRLPTPAVYPIADGSLQELLRAINRQSFAADRLRVLQQAAPANYFLVGQAQQVLTSFSFSADRLTAVRYLKPRLLDPENYYRLYESFTFSSDKQKLREILAQ
jgi:Domain of unknown function (DUF4476)